MSPLRSALEQYLSMRQGLGYKYQHQARRLAEFVSFMEKRKANEARRSLGDSATRSARILGLAINRRARFRAPCREHRSWDGGATRRHLATPEAGQALCLQRCGDRGVTEGGTCPASCKRTAPLNLSLSVRPDRSDGHASVRGDRA